KQRVLAATVELLREGGLAGVSVDDVCRRSGVAKTTIYRHWPSAPELFLAACATLGEKPVAPDTGDLQRDIGEVLRQVADGIARSSGAVVWPSILAAAQRDRRVADLLSEVQARFSEPLETLIAAAQARGLLPKAIPASELVAQLLGPLYYRRWFSHA